VVNFRVLSLLTLFGFIFANFVFAQEDPFARERQRMVKEDLAGRDITDRKVLDAMGKVKRHLFVDKDLWDQAYKDHPLPIGEGQTISQPYVVALMAQALAIMPGEKVLEIGTGAGYQAAVLAELTDKVYTIEILPRLAQEAAQRLHALGYASVKVKCGDGYAGWEEYAPFDAIIITCAADHIPPALLKQLKVGGKLIIPLETTAFTQDLTLVTKKENEVKRESLGGVVFVPMTGKAQH
jgi:protein-L-isoaspartate(D-aspartate) O-methyltransferase